MLEQVPIQGAILVLKPGFAPQFEPTPDQQNVADAVLSPGVELRGVVVNSSGKPIPDVTVTPVTNCPATGVCNPI
ncbi:MAG: hypothetical protein U0903_10455 [Planctomycetales bacterium]